MEMQQLTLTKADSDVQIRIFVHKGRISQEKLPDAKKAFIDPYVAATMKQFVAMGAKPEQVPDSSEIPSAKPWYEALMLRLAGRQRGQNLLGSGEPTCVVYTLRSGQTNETTPPRGISSGQSWKVVDPKAAPGPSPKACR